MGSKAVSQTEIVESEQFSLQGRLRKHNLVRAVLACVLFGLAGQALHAATWHIEMVDQQGAGKFTSLKIDKEGNAHLAYVIDDNNAALEYAYWDHALKRWFVMKVADGASFPSLVLDSNQRPHISWADFGTVRGCKLRYGYWDGKSWITQAIPLPSVTVAFYTSLALDGDDKPSISFYEYDGPQGTDFRVRMRVVSWNGKYWQVSTVDGSNQSGKFNALAAEANGHLHLAYANVNAGTAGLRYGFWDGASWHTEEVDGLFAMHRAGNNLGYVGEAASIVLDRDGEPHMSYLNLSVPSVKYAVRKNGNWAVEVVDWLVGTAYPDRNSITLDEEGRPYLGYYDAARGSLKIAFKDGSNWVNETIDGNFSGFTSSIQVHEDTVWISYTDQGAGGVKVARASLSELRREGSSPKSGKERETARLSLWP